MFASIEEPEEFPVIGRPKPGSKLDREFQAYLKEEDKKLQNYIDEKHRAIMKRFRGQVGDYLLVVRDADGEDDQALRTLSGRRKLSPEAALRWKAWLADHPDDAVFGLWRSFAALPEEGFGARAAEVANQQLLGAKINARVATAFSSDEPPPASLKEVAERYQAVFSRVDEEWQKRLADDPEHPPAGFANDLEREELRKLLYGPDAPGVMPAGDFKKLDRPVFLELIGKKADRTLRLALHPGSPRRAMVYATRRSSTILMSTFEATRTVVDRRLTVTLSKC